MGLGALGVVDAAERPDAAGGGRLPGGLRPCRNAGRDGRLRSGLEPVRQFGRRPVLRHQRHDHGDDDRGRAADRGRLLPQPFRPGRAALLGGHACGVRDRARRAVADGVDRRRPGAARQVPGLRPLRAGERHDAPDRLRRLDAELRDDVLPAVRARHAAAGAERPLGDGRGDHGGGGRGPRAAAREPGAALLRPAAGAGVRRRHGAGCLPPQARCAPILALAGGRAGACRLRRHGGRGLAMAAGGARPDGRGRRDGDRRLRGDCRAQRARRPGGMGPTARRRLLLGLPHPFLLHPAGDQGRRAAGPWPGRGPGGDPGRLPAGGGGGRGGPPAPGAAADRPGAARAGVAAPAGLSPRPSRLAASPR